MTRFWLAAFLAVAAVRCGGVAKTNAGELCVPGQRAECDCTGHTKGVRTCTAEGIGYGECVCSGSTSDSGAPGGGGTPTPVCASKAAWTNGLQPSAEMTPGRPCVGCHNTTNAPFTAAGTIFVDVHEPDDCYGVDGLGVAVALLDVATGTELVSRLQVNRAGNFYTSIALPPAYRVKVISGGRESNMMSAVMDGDCNACHTATGVAGARGRLVKPPP